MKLRPFKELVAMSKEKLDEAMAPIRARQVKAKAELEIAKFESNILAMEASIQELCVNKDINFTQLLDKLDELALLERRQKQCNDVIKQLFPAE